MSRQELDAFLNKAFSAAQASGHIFPAHAACEAALESAWGTSKLAVLCNNLFGLKAATRGPNPYPLINMPTKEYLHGQWVTQNALWPKYPDWLTAFRERMNTLNRLPSIYGEALVATSGEEFVREVSKHWSTDPQRAEKVLQIYRAHGNVFSSQSY